tara:strand:+ start:24525 stop:24896 length:372 start_codon:yes stop_codon:yes gene_type:complete
MIKILLVDDNAPIRNAIKIMLNSELEIQVIGECSDGSEVIPFLQNTIPDVILMDYQMPILDGVETTKLVKGLFPEIKIIGFSSTDDKYIKTAFLIHGACSFLSKYEANSNSLVGEISNCCSVA